MKTKNILIEQLKGEREFNPKMNMTDAQINDLAQDIVDELSKKIDNIVIDGIDTKDYPDFSNAYIVSADYDGVPMTDKQLDEINDDGDFQHECIINDLQ